MIKKIKAYIKNLLVELGINGKSLIVYVIQEIPGLTQYPGLVEALQAAANNPTTANVAYLLLQVFWTGAAGHRLLKVLGNALVRTKTGE